MKWFCSRATIQDKQITDARKTAKIQGDRKDIRVRIVHVRPVQHRLNVLATKVAVLGAPCKALSRSPDLPPK